MDSSGKVALVLSYQYPGKYAFTVLAGAVESDAALADVPIHFPRDRESLLATLRQCVDEGYTVVAAWSFYSASFGPGPPATSRSKMNAPTMNPHAHSPRKAMIATLRRFSFSLSN